jgi:hypothetical protein
MYSLECVGSASGVQAAVDAVAQISPDIKAALKLRVGALTPTPGQEIYLKVNGNDTTPGLFTETWDVHVIQHNP